MRRVLLPKTKRMELNEKRGIVWYAYKKISRHDCNLLIHQNHCKFSFIYIYSQLFVGHGFHYLSVAFCLRLVSQTVPQTITILCSRNCHVVSYHPSIRPLPCSLDH
jgi:hypothetical protein